MAFADVDYNGLAVFITSIGTLIGVIVGAIVTLRQAKATANKVDAIHDEVKTSNGTTVGEIVEANDLRNLGKE